MYKFVGLHTYNLRSMNDIYMDLVEFILGVVALTESHLLSLIKKFIKHLFIFLCKKSSVFISGVCIFLFGQELNLCLLAVSLVFLDYANQFTYLTDRWCVIKMQLKQQKHELLRFKREK